MLPASRTHRNRHARTTAFSHDRPSLLPARDATRLPFLVHEYPKRKSRSGARCGERLRSLVRSVAHCLIPAGMRLNIRGTRCRCSRPGHRDRSDPRL